MRVTLATLLGALVSACAATPDSVDHLTPEPDATESVGQTSAALTTYAWSQGQPPVALLPVSDGFCYLSAVQGAFEGAGERVLVGVDPVSRVWQLGGTSGQAGVGASATCVRYSELRNAPTHTVLEPGLLGVFDEYTCVSQWFGGDTCFHSKDAVRFKAAWGYGDDSICALARVSGKFMGGGERLWLWAPQSGRPWTIGAIGSYDTGGGNDIGVYGDAGCVSFGATVKTLGDYSWAQGQPPVELPPRESSFCFFTSLSGKLKGEGERIEIGEVYDARDRATHWSLRGRSMQEGVAATVRCVGTNISGKPAISG